MSAVPRRLGKMVREATGLSVEAVDWLWHEGRVELGRGAPFGLGELIYQDDTVLVDGTPLATPADRVDFVLHKPEGITTTACDPEGLADLQPWLATLPRGTFPVGRLDRDTSGLLLLTSDGDLAHALLTPDHHVEKEYLVRVRWRIEPDDPRLGALRRGIALDGEVVVPVRVEWMGHANCASDLLRVVVCEGKHRQVRRMCRGALLPPSALARTRLGPLHLGDLRASEVRALTDAEVTDLWRAVGGRDEVRRRQRLALHELAHRRQLAGTPDLRLERWLSREG